MSEESNHKSYVRQFGQRPRVDSELGVLPNIVSCTTYGVKGTLSEFELQGIKARLVGGQRSAAARGALKMRLPVGLAYNDRDEVVFDPDRSVVDAIRSCSTASAGWGRRWRW